MLHCIRGNFKRSKFCKPQQRSSILSYRYRNYDTFSSKYRIGIVSVSKFKTWKVSVLVSVSKFQMWKYQYQYRYHLSPKQVSSLVSVLFLALQVLEILFKWWIQLIFEQKDSTLKQILVSNWVSVHLMEVSVSISVSKLSAE